MDVLEQTGRDDGPPDHPPRPLVWILAGVVAAGLIVAAVLGALRDPAPLDPGTPEGVVQVYLQAVLDGDVTTARNLLSQDLAENCSVQDLRDSWVPEGVTASLGDVRHLRDEVEVEVRLRTVAGPPPFGAGGQETTEFFTLIEVAGEWRIDGATWPVHDCGVAR